MTRREQVAIRAEGAELFVAALLMLEYGIPVSIASRNMPGYDLVAHNPGTGLDCRLQVKYRSAIDANGARLKHFGFDFMVYVAGNVGRIGSTIPLRAAETRPTEVFVLPRAVVEANIRPPDLFPNPARGGFEGYRDAWRLVLEHLGVSPS